MTNAIEVRGLNWKPGKNFAIQELDLTVPKGAIYGFLGPNGSGKTTTIRLLMGMVKPDSGEMQVLGGRVPKDLPSILARTGYVPEKPHLYPALTVTESIRYHGSFFDGIPVCRSAVQKNIIPLGRELFRAAAVVNHQVVEFRLHLR